MAIYKPYFTMSPNHHLCGYDKDIRNCNAKNTSLHNKYAKLMHFGFWLVSNVDISNDIRNDLFDKLYLFANAETQEDFYENFYSNEKEIAKTMRKFITEKLREQQKEPRAAKEIVPIGRDQIFRDAFIDNIIALFNGDGRTNHFVMPL